MHRRLAGDITERYLATVCAHALDDRYHVVVEDVFNGVVEGYRDAACSSTSDLDRQISQCGTGDR